ncbi:MAG: AarF/ABC1/UbiB kinase family protein [Candidatus Omnitrophica bacterium]|nr:AarF/ABC1/UbiB kinase family protein [Candidatus Omnitrophota bacterium]
MYILSWDEYVQLFADHAEWKGNKRERAFISRYKDDPDKLGIFWGEVGVDVDRRNFLAKWRERNKKEEGESSASGEKDGSTEKYGYTRHADAALHYREMSRLSKVSDKDDPRVLSQFGFIANSKETFETWVKYITDTYTPTVFRNYFLYSALVHKVLAPAGNFDADKVFDLEYVKKYISALPAQEVEKVSEAVIAIRGYFVYDHRVEGVNAMEVMMYAASIGVFDGERKARKSLKRREVALRELESPNKPLYMTPGGPDAQLDIFVHLLGKEEMDKKISASNGTFSKKLAFIIENMPARRNTELDAALDKLLSSSGAELDDLEALFDIEKLKARLKDHKEAVSALDKFDIANDDDNKSIFLLPLLRDKWAFRALELDHERNGAKYLLVKDELERIKHYFPAYGFFRDAILDSFIERRVENPEDLAAAEKLLVESSGNILKDGVMQMMMGRDIAHTLLMYTSEETRSLMLEWMLGWSNRKPPDVVLFEYHYGIDMNVIRNEIFGLEDGKAYKGTKGRIEKKIIEALVESFAGDDEICEKFSDSMLGAIIPTEAGDRKKGIYHAVMDAVMASDNFERKKDIFTACALEWLKIKREDRTVGPGEIEARMLAAFFQANGFMGVKLAQVLSDSNVVDLDPEIRKALGNLKFQVEPISKAIAIKIIDRVLPGGFKQKLKRLIGRPVGSASLKVAYAAETLDGKRVIVKVKRPEVVALLDDDIRSLSENLRFVTPQFRLLGVNLPDNLVDTVKDALLKELDFEKEKRDQEALGRILKSRKNSGGVSIRVPSGVDVYSDFVMIEEFIEGTVLERKDELAKRGIKYSKIKQALKQELLHEFFVDGVFHIDPHAGNIIVTDKNNVVFIDNAVGRIDPELRPAFFTFFLNIHGSRISRYFAESSGWPLEKAVAGLCDGAGNDPELIKNTASKLEEEIRSGRISGNISKKFVGALFFLEKNGITLKEGTAAAKKFFSAADYLVGDVGLTDAVFLARIFHEIMNNGRTGKTEIAPLVRENAAAVVTKPTKEVRPNGASQKKSSPDKAARQGKRRETRSSPAVILKRSQAIAQKTDIAVRNALTGLKNSQADLIDVVVDAGIASGSSPDAQENAATWAGLIASTVRRPGVNFVFTDAGFMAMVKSKLSEIDSHLTGIVECVPRDASSRVLICGKKALEKMRQKSEKLAAREYPVAMDDECPSGEVAVMNYQAAVNIGLVEAILGITREKDALSGTKEYDSLKSSALRQLNRIYEAVFGEKDMISERTVDYMTHNTPDIRMNLAITLALRPIERVPLELARAIHEKIRAILIAA